MNRPPQIAILNKDWSRLRNSHKIRTHYFRLPKA